jgi:hypothetical protein
MDHADAIARALLSGCSTGPHSATRRREPPFFYEPRAEAAVATRHPELKEPRAGSARLSKRAGAETPGRMRKQSMDVLAPRPRRRNNSDLRHRCRQCRGQLPVPTNIPQYGFCTKFCWQQFYRKRCVVCEEPIRRRAEHQKACMRRECKNELRRYPHLYQLPKRGQGSQNVVTPLRSADKTGVKSALKNNRAQIVGPARVLDVELFDRAWRPAVSSGGVPLEVGRLRSRALVDRDRGDWRAATDGGAS